MLVPIWSVGVCTYVPKIKERPCQGNKGPAGLLAYIPTYIGSSTYGILRQLYPIHPHRNRTYHAW